MAKPRIFVSSTFYDLRHIRSSLENFIRNLGFEPILSEKGNIAYNPDFPLDESCYKEAESCNILVLIIGGRYGSTNSADEIRYKRELYDRYESITKLEYESAIEKDIPVYILIERSVFSEYDTFKNNRNNESIKYAHVDSVNIFFLIERILNQPQNNPVQTFERYQEIEYWLKEQWAGLFNDLLSKRSENNQLSSLPKQIYYIEEVNKTLKTYLEEIVSKVSKENAENIIKKEEKRLEERKKEKDFEGEGVVTQLVNVSKIPIEKVKEIYIKVNSLDEFARYIERESKLDRFDAESLIARWKKNPQIVEKINKPVTILGLKPLKFEKSNK